MPSSKPDNPEQVSVIEPQEAVAAQAPPAPPPAEAAPMNRWWVVLGAVLIQFCLGAIYAWNIFATQLVAGYGYTGRQTQLIFGVGLAAFSILMILTGRVIGRFTPRQIALTGGLVLGLGYVLGSFVVESFPLLLLSIGLIGGAGIGIAYVIPIAVGVKWFPDRKGLLTGLAVAGFGFGAMVWINLAGSWAGLLERLGVGGVFFWYGIAFALLVLLGSLWMVDPPAGYRPAGWTPPQPAAGKAAPVELGPVGMLRTWQFYLIWMLFMSGSLAGLMVIGCIGLFAEATLESVGLDALAVAATVSLVWGVFGSIGNGAGRIAWGMISDAIGRRVAVCLMFLVQGLVLLAFYPMGFSPWLLYFGAAVIGFNFGGTLALFPAVTADVFGSKNMGKNYGWVFTAYGFGGIVGPYLGGWFGDLAESAGDLRAWLIPFVTAALLCLAAAAATWLLKPPVASATKG